MCDRGESRKTRLPFGFSLPCGNPQPAGGVGRGAGSAARWVQSTCLRPAPGEAGPGAHITVYANAGHAFMIVDGRRFDTSALSGGGTRWTSQMRSTAGFVARHPPGL